MPSAPPNPNPTDTASATDTDEAAGPSSRRAVAPVATALRVATRPAAVLTAGLRRRVARIARDRLEAATLDDRDSHLVRDALPIAWLLAGAWFRAEVRGLHHVPRTGPVLLVGNHSGGAVSPDAFVLAVGMASHFGPERPLHLLLPSALPAYPGLGVVRRLGVLPTGGNGGQVARDALNAGGCVAVYPGGAAEARRPSWHSGRLDLGDLDGVVRAALNARAPLVPVVAIGGQETALFLGRGEGLARALGLDRAFGITELPIALGPPWGIAIGDLAGRLPLPAKIVVQLLPPVDLEERYGVSAQDPPTRAVLDEIAADLSATMQEMLDDLSRRRRLPLVG